MSIIYKKATKKQQQKKRFSWGGVKKWGQHYNITYIIDIGINYRLITNSKQFKYYFNVNVYVHCIKWLI